MADYNSKYTGEQVEQLLDQVASGGAGGGGGVAVETDPIFSASPAATITEDKITEWNNKYEKPELGIPKTDLDQEVNNILHAVEVTDLPQLAADVASVVETINDLNTDVAQLYEDKQDKIADLDTIRSGAEKGATAVQPSDLYNDNNGEILPRLIVKRGLIEDTEVGFTYALPFSSEESLGDADTTLATTDLAEQIARSVAYIEEEDSSFTRTRVKNGLLQVEVDGELREIYALPNLDDDLQGEADYVIATDKDIQQLDGKVYVWKPTSFVLNSTFNVSGVYSNIKNSKIVILDLNTARYISAPITIDASGNITLNFVSHTATSMQIITALISTDAKCTTSASNVTFPTLDEKEAWSGKQDKLVSGTNIKTVNGESILGSGDITISGGSSGGGSGAYPWVSIEGDTIELMPNTYYTGDRGDPLNVILGEPLEDVTSEYVFMIYNASIDPLPVAFEEDIIWANGAPPFNSFCFTEVSIIEYCGVWVEYKDE